MSLPIVVKTKLGNLHATESPLQVPVSPLTTIALNKLTKDQLSSFEQALNDLINRQSLLIKDETRKQTNMPLNLSALKNSVVRIPDTNLPDLGHISQVVFSLLHSLPSDVGQSLQIQIQLSSEARDPLPLQDFQRRKGALITGNLSRHITELLQSYAVINGLRLEVERINGV